MALDLQKLALRRLLESQDQDYYSKISSKYFTGVNLQVFERIRQFYRAEIKLPSVDEFIAIRKDVDIQEYLETQIFNEQNKNDEVNSGFLINQLQDFFVREETIGFLDRFIDTLDDLEKIEIIDGFQNHILELNKGIPTSDQLLDVAEMETLPTKDTFTMFTSGLSNEYDAINGGFALQELVMIGGRRGSGKSIMVLNATLHRFLQGHTVALFSIEMRYLEIYYRLMSILSGIPFLSFMLSKLTEEEKYTIALTKLQYFYKPNDKFNDLLKELKDTHDLKRFDSKLKLMKPEFKENRFFIIDEESLSLNRIDHYCNMFVHKYPNYSMGTVDYLNIIKIEDSKDWKTQITMAEYLKSLARKYNLTMLTPYQIDSSLEARFAKGILDSADRAFTFTPADINENPHEIPMHITKIRNGKEINFKLYMDWECVKVYPELSKVLQSKLLAVSKYGSGRDENDGEGDKDV